MCIVQTEQKDRFSMQNTEPYNAQNECGNGQAGKTIKK